MEHKISKPGLGPSAAGLLRADKQIDVLCDKVLPHIPHLLSVPTKTPYTPIFPNENKHTPFEPWEVMNLQYMTLISNGDRGVGYAQGNWEDEMSNTRSPSIGAQSNTSTPNPGIHKESGKPAVKMSYADYQKFKTTGVKPLLKPAAATPESKGRSEGLDRNHSRDISAIAVHTSPMARVPSFEGGDSRHNGKGSRTFEQKASSKDDRSVPPRSVPTETREPTRTVPNGHPTRESFQSKDTNKDLRVSKAGAKEPPRHGLPPRPSSPRKGRPELKQQKRPLESNTTSQPEKRTKVDHAELQTSSNLLKTAQHKADLTKSQKSAVSPHPPRKAIPSTKPLNTKSSISKGSSPEKPLNLPPLLSPLPNDLVEPPQLNLSSVKKSDLSTLNKKTPSPRVKAAVSDTIVVKSTNSKAETLTSSSTIPPVSSSSLFVLPRLLSPDLPEVVEAELLRLQQKSSALNTVEARHQEVRQPNAPGVAQKRPKVGHPPKKARDESSKATKRPADPSYSTDKVDNTQGTSSKKPSAPSKLSLVVKLQYKKRLSKDIERLLKMRQTPWPASKVASTPVTKRVERERPPPAPEESESEEDASLHQRYGKKAPAIPTSKKRPMESSDRVEPEPKRAKVPEKLDIHKATSTPLAPPFKSPAPAGQSSTKEKALLATPKKADAIKSVAMRRVESGDGHVRTPQASATNAPASAEKVRANGVLPANTEEIRRARQEDSKLSQLGTDLKRRSQATLKNESISESERKRGVMTGVESLMAYMLAFHARYITNPDNPKSWEDFFPIWHFVQGHAKRYPELFALSETLGAVSREQLTKIYIKEARENVWEKLVYTMNERDKLWSRSKLNEKYISDLGIHGVLGPWSSVSDAVSHGITILKRYSSSHRLDWTANTQFSEGSAKPFLTSQTEVTRGGR